jgi:hypothetical protein
MILSVKAFVAVILLCSSSSLLRAQTESVIDARGKEPSQPTCCYFVDFSGFGSHPNETLTAVFTIDDPANVTATSRMDYQMVITNTGKKSVVIPRSLDWKDVDTASSELRFLRASLLFQLRAKDGSDIWLSKGGVTLYSSDDRPSTRLVLGPGDSVRILGSTTLAGTTVAGSKSGKAMLSAQFCVGSVVWTRPTPTKDASKESGTLPGWKGQSLGCASVESNYEVNLVNGLDAAH